MPSIKDPRALSNLEDRLMALRPDTTRRWGTLSPGEVLCHLHDSVASVLARPGGSRSQTRPIRKWVALRSGLPWPHHASTLPHTDPRRDGTRPTDFERDRENAINSLRILATAAPSPLPSSHRVFGNMTPEDWSRWAFRHTDHHLRQFGL